MSNFFKKSNLLTIFRTCFLLYKASKLCSWIKKLLTVVQVPACPPSSFHTLKRIPYGCNSWWKWQFHQRSAYRRLSFNLNLSFTSSHPRAQSHWKSFLLLLLCVCCWCVFILCIQAVWIILDKKCTQIKRFLHTGQTCALFIWTGWVFFTGISRNTAYTLWKLYSVRLWQVEFTTINLLRLFIIFQCIHLKQVKHKAANFHSLPDFTVQCAQTLQNACI